MQTVKKKAKKINTGKDSDTKAGGGQAKNCDPI
jgi:hypothetical protein